MNETPDGVVTTTQFPCDYCEGLPQPTLELRMGEERLHICMKHVQVLNELLRDFTYRLWKLAVNG